MRGLKVRAIGSFGKTSKGIINACAIAPTNCKPVAARAISADITDLAARQRRDQIRWTDYDNRDRTVAIFRALENRYWMIVELISSRR